MSGSSYFTPRILAEFLWRGALLGIAGGLFVGILMVQILATAVVMLLDESRITCVTVPVGTLLSLVAGTIAGRMDGTEDCRGHIAFAGYIGFTLGGHVSIVATLLIVLFWFVVIVGPIAGLLGGLLVGAAAALISRCYRLPAERERFPGASRWMTTLVAFVVGVPAIVFLLRYFYPFPSPDGISEGLAWIALSTFGGLLGTAFIWFTHPFLTEWYLHLPSGPSTRVQHDGNADGRLRNQSA